MGTKIFIDGHAGTIGLRIRELLSSRTDLSFLEPTEARRKDPAARRELINTCDVAILCLPDDASVEVVSWIENPNVRVIDGSTAFRVNDAWAYGLPELAPEQRAAIKTAKRVSNPGCWPTCVSLLTRPLVDAGLVPRSMTRRRWAPAMMTRARRPRMKTSWGSRNIVTRRLTSAKWFANSCTSRCR
jgi:N-acetyl-gamma-glutamyl-phosphate reductase